MVCIWSSSVCAIHFGLAFVVIAGFIDSRPRPIWRRWAAYMNRRVAVIGAGGVQAVYFKTGPFSWNGIIGICSPLALFLIGMTVNAWLLHRRTEYEATLQGARPGRRYGSRCDSRTTHLA